MEGTLKITTPPAGPPAQAAQSPSTALDTSMDGAPTAFFPPLSPHHIKYKIFIIKIINLAFNNV